MKIVSRVATRKISLHILFIVIMCGGLFLITAMFTYEAYNGINTSISSGANLTIRQSVITVEQAIRGTLATAGLSVNLLESTNLGKATTLDERLNELPSMAKVLQEHPTLSAVYVGYETGDFFYLYKYTESLDGSSLRDALPDTAFLLTSIVHDAKNKPRVNYWALDKSLKNYTPYDADGAVAINPKVKGTLLLKPTTRGWYKQAMASNSVVSTRPYLFFASNDLGITMAKKVADGKAVIAADIYTSDLKKVLISLRATPRSEIAISDSFNELAAYTKNHIPQQNEVGPDGSINVTSLNVPAFNELLKGNAPTSKIIPFNDGNENWSTYISPIEEYYGNPLNILIAIPNSELMYQSELDAKAQIIIIGLLLLIFLIGALIIAELMFSPIKIIADHLDTLSHFNFSTPLHFKTSFKEMAQLRDTLNQISASLIDFQSIILTLNQEKDSDKMFSTVLKLILNIVKLDSGRIYIREGQVLKLVAHQGTYEYLASEIEIPEKHLSDEQINEVIHDSLEKDEIYSLLKSSNGNVLGVMCVAINDDNAKDKTPESLEKLQQYVANIASAAAVGIETRQLISSQKALLDAIIHLIANAIDAKSPYTGGHCKRVPELALMILKEAGLSQKAPFDKLRLDPDGLEEFRIAAWLHDCGKVTTPEYVVDKATKLETIFNRIHEIRTRFEVLYRDATIRYLEAIINGEDKEIALERRQMEEKQLQDDFAFIAKCNIGNEFMSDEDLERLKQLASITWQRNFDNRLGLSREELGRCTDEENNIFPVTENLLANKKYHISQWRGSPPQVRKGDPGNTLGFDMQPPEVMNNAGELYNLSIQRGTLTAEERFKINDHIIQSIIMLNALPWPENLKQVPEIACNHHESLSGNGYPRKLKADMISIPARIMAMADVFEALTAPDRPYKNGKKLSEAMPILANMVKANHLDKDIFTLFLKSGVYMEYAKRFINPDQIDEIDINIYLGVAGL